MPNMYDKNFADRIDTAVKTIGGISKASAIIGVSYPTIGRWKDGSSDPKLSNIVALADAAGVSLDWLVNGSSRELNAATADIAAISAEKGVSVEDAIDTLKTMIQDTQPKLTEEEAFLLKEFRALDDDQRRMMLRFIIGGFDSLNSGGNKGIFNSPNAQIEDSFKG